MSDTSFLLSLLQCPQCRSGALSFRKDRENLVCSHCSVHFPVVKGCPVLLRQDNSIFHVEDYLYPPLLKRSRAVALTKLIPSPSINLSSRRVLGRIRDILLQKQCATILVVGCGLQRQCLDGQLRSGAAIRIIYTDIDVGADVDLYCDAHNLPFPEQMFDAVITTAVLEHVLSPEQVTAEIHRVLKIDGVLYSELPFMQQVHEGAYDFTRYTLSGHRRLFNKFSELDSGMVAGPATALVWAIENFTLGFAGNRTIRLLMKASVRIAFGWLKYFDYLLEKKPGAMDGASCTYFLGRKIEDRIPDTEIIARYVGSKHYQHT